MKRLWLCNVIISIVYFNTTVCDKNNSINLSQGEIKGSYHTLGGYWSYLGVPYAEFKGRFQEPGDPPTWNGTFKAIRSQSCIQYSPVTKTIMGEEDCLTLNVYTLIPPSNTIAKPLSVIIFIHGGGFFWGSNTDAIYNAKFLVQKEVVVVTINYRVSAFGFLCLKNNGAAGNMGLKDQLAALIWTKNNIASFGGDPESVTLFGESAGAFSVDYFILTQSAKGLFHRAIMDSGTSLSPLAYDREPILTAVGVASLLGYNTTNSNELLKIFLNASALDIARVSYRDNTNDALAPYVFKPCTENPNTSNTTVITTDPCELIKSVKDISNISIIIGYNNKEGIYWARHYDRSGLKMLDRNFSSAIPDTFIYRKPEYKADLVDDVRKFYFNNSSTNYSALSNYFSDVLIMAPSVVTMEAYLSNPKISLYVYYFSYDSFRNLVKLLSRLRTTKGASHADELFYLFNSIPYRYIPSIPSDSIMIDRMTTLWTNFAKTGVPSEEIVWPRSENILKFLNLDKELKVIDLPNKDRIDFWKRFYENYA